MKLSSRSSLADVAVAVGDVLRRSRIRAVLTGGACANLYTGGEYTSLDADFVLIGPCTTSQLDEAMATLGFARKRDRYVHPGLPFFVEFPRGPLGIGEDIRVRPVWRRGRTGRTLALSATDACRDRLAAFYHWNDHQSLEAAIAIALRHKVGMTRIQEWSRREGHVEGYRAFRAGVERSRAARRNRSTPRPSAGA